MLSSYFYSVGLLMDYDRSVLFANAYRYNAYPHTASNTSTIIRAAGYPFYGWMVRRSDANYLLKNWAPLGLVSPQTIYISDNMSIIVTTITVIKSSVDIFSDYYALYPYKLIVLCNKP